MVGQTKKHSLIEQVLNVGSGFIIALLLWAYVVTPYMGVEYHLKEGLVITSLFTVVSIVRGYLWRRLGNYITVKYKEGRCHYHQTH